MKKLLALLTSLLLTACGNNVSSKYYQLKEDPQASEDEFIKRTIESMTATQASLIELEQLLSDIQETDSDWLVKVSFIELDLGVAANDVSYIYLSDELEKKYAETLVAKEKAVNEANAIRGDINKADDTYDKRLFQDVYSRISPAKQSIQKVLDQIEVDRYE